MSPLPEEPRIRDLDAPAAPGVDVDTFVRPDFLIGRARQRSARAWPAPLTIGACALGIRIVSALLALFISLAFPLHQRQQFTVFHAPSPFWDTFARYDSGYYEGIAWDGYKPLAGGRSNIAFFPAYPLLMRLVGRLFGRQQAAYYISGIGISWVCFILAMVALYYLARLDVPRRQAQRAVLLTAIFPFSFFFGVVYSESTFLLFAVLSLYCFRTRRWLAGGLCGAVATATRVPGILMVPALAWIAWRAAAPVRRDRLLAAAGLALAAAGFVAYCVYVFQLTGNPFEWAATLQRWGYHPGGYPWLASVRLIQRLATHPYLYLTTDPMAPYDTLYGMTGVLFVVAVPFVWRRLGGAYALFMVLNLWLPLSSGVFEGMGRYCSLLFPCFIWLATVRSAWVSTSIVVVFSMFYTLGLALFTTIHPIF
jgi:Mannosyltransferase (PIG-V)